MVTRNIDRKSCLLNIFIKKSNKLTFYKKYIFRKAKQKISKQKKQKQKNKQMPDVFLNAERSLGNWGQQEDLLRATGDLLGSAGRLTGGSRETYWVQQGDLMWAAGSLIGDSRDTYLSRQGDLLRAGKTYWGQQ